MIYFYRGREAGNTDTETLSEKDKMLEAKEAEVCTVLYLPSTLSGVGKVYRTIGHRTFFEFPENISPRMEKI
jgi:hypothetical protein